MAKRWTKEEHLIIDKYYEEGGAKLCITKGLDRTVGQIDRRAGHLGYNRYTEWVLSDLIKLRKYYTIKDTRELQTMFSKYYSIRSIHIQANIEGLM